MYEKYAPILNKIVKEDTGKEPLFVQSPPRGLTEYMSEGAIRRLKEEVNMRGVYIEVEGEEDGLSLQQMDEVRSSA